MSATEPVADPPAATPAALQEGGTASWTVVLPVKSLGQAKTRLRRSLGEVAGLALAFALDTASAAASSTRVAGIVVVTDDPTVRSAMGGLAGVRFLPDPGGGLNAAISAGVTAVSGAVVVLPADLPSLTARDLDAALALALGHPLSMVADHSGSGTTFLASVRADGVVPRFGEGSRRAHEDAGHTVLGIDPSSPLRWDVDTADDLAVALRIGVGPSTARAVAEVFAPRP